MPEWQLWQRQVVATGFIDQNDDSDILALRRQLLASATDFNVEVHVLICSTKVAPIIIAILTYKPTRLIKKVPGTIKYRTLGHDFMHVR